MKLEVRRARRGLLSRGQWYGRVLSSNGAELWRTSETYANVGDVMAAWEAVIRELDGNAAKVAVEVIR